MQKKLIEQYLHSLKPSEKRYLEKIQKGKAIWQPQSKRQWQAFLSRADELYFGGAAGGGKTDLLIGMAVACHQHSVIFRRKYPNLKEIMRRTREIIPDGSADENKSDKTWTFHDGRTVEFGAMQYERDKRNWQGRPHDLKAYDEGTELLEQQYIFTSAWNRCTDPNQRVRIILTGNPPTDESGNWVIDRWGAWLKPDHPHPAFPGELRWYATVDGEEREFENGDPVEIEGETIYPKSRTFILSMVEDNPYYAHDSHYKSVLQSLPEPLRSQLLYGDFTASDEADPWQVIPSEWVRAAQERWLENDKPELELTGVGVDAVRGGMDKMAISKRYGNYFAEVATWPGKIVTDGQTGAAILQKEIGDELPGYINVDIIGVGSTTYDFAKEMFSRCINGLNVSNKSDFTDRTGRLKMRNKRAEIYWRMREALDPIHGEDLMLPPGNVIIADLCSARYKVSASGVLVEAKEDIKKRIGRSPDDGEAILMAHYDPGKFNPADFDSLGAVEGYENPWA
ncbi:MAG: terminase family protein [Euryarchaeota archaeon]|nr:terminase family protein [Euryarchaeota archaeon]